MVLATAERPAVWGRRPCGEDARAHSLCSAAIVPTKARETAGPCADHLRRGLAPSLNDRVLEPEDHGRLTPLAPPPTGIHRCGRADRLPALPHRRRAPHHEPIPAKNADSGPGLRTRRVRLATEGGDRPTDDPAPLTCLPAKESPAAHLRRSRPNARAGSGACNEAQRHARRSASAGTATQASGEHCRTNNENPGRPTEPPWVPPRSKSCLRPALGPESCCYGTDQAKAREMTKSANESKSAGLRGRPDQAGSRRSQDEAKGSR